MAKHRKSKGRRQSLAVINVSESLALLTLADDAVLGVDTDPFGREFYAISADLYWGVRNHTAGEGPIIVGIAHNDYTDVEVAENLNLTGMEDPGDQIAKEQGRRLVRRAGQFAGQTTDEVLNDGKPMRVRIGFVITDGFSLAFWAQNKNGGSLTTGAVLEISGKIYGRWI